MFFDFRMLFLDALDELEQYRILVVEVIHDVADFYLAFDVDNGNRSPPSNGPFRIGDSGTSSQTEPHMPLENSTLN